MPVLSHVSNLSSCAAAGGYSRLKLIPKSGARFKRIRTAFLLQARQRENDRKGPELDPVPASTWRPYRSTWPDPVQSEPPCPQHVSLYGQSEKCNRSRIFQSAYLRGRNTDARRWSDCKLAEDDIRMYWFRTSECTPLPETDRSTWSSKRARNSRPDR